MSFLASSRSALVLFRYRLTTMFSGIKEGNLIDFEDFISFKNFEHVMNEFFWIEELRHSILGCKAELSIYIKNKNYKLQYCKGKISH